VTDRERLARAALSRLTEPGEPRLARLVGELGAVAVHDHIVGERDLEGLRGDVAARLADARPDEDLARAASRGIRFVIPGDPEWPKALDDLAHPEPLQDRGGPPLGLWARGPLRLDTLGGAVAVVGSRSATSYGGDVARDLAAALGAEAVPVVSGAAFGIDQAAHRGALAGGGPTVAVLACGVDRAYPAAHRPLLDHLAEQGLVVSEVPPGGAPTRLRFLARNRMIAGLCRGTVVVEAAVRSGALNTANWTERLNRVLMGVPGPVTSASSQGVHQLLRTGAVLVTSGAEVLEQVGHAGEHLLAPPRAPTRPRDSLRTREAQVLDAVPARQPAQADSIARAAGLGLLDVRRQLDHLQRRGLVERGPAGWLLSDAART